MSETAETTLISLTLGCSAPQILTQAFPQKKSCLSPARWSGFLSLSLMIWLALCCLWQAIIYFCLLSRSFWCPLRQIHVLLNMWLISTGIWTNKHNLGRLWQLPLTFTTTFYTHFGLTLHGHSRPLQHREHWCKQLTFPHIKYHRPSMSWVSVINFAVDDFTTLPSDMLRYLHYGHHGHHISVIRTVTHSVSFNLNKEEIHKSPKFNWSYKKQQNLQPGV